MIHSHRSPATETLMTFTSPANHPALPPPPSPDTSTPAPPWTSTHLKSEHKHPQPAKHSHPYLPFPSSVSSQSLRQDACTTCPHPKQGVCSVQMISPHAEHGACRSCSVAHLAHRAWATPSPSLRCGNGVPHVGHVSRTSRPRQMEAVGASAGILPREMRVLV